MKYRRFFFWIVVGIIAWYLNIQIKDNKISLDSVKNTIVSTFIKEKENKDLTQNSDRSNEKLHLSIVTHSNLRLGAKVVDSEQNTGVISHKDSHYVAATVPEPEDTAWQGERHPASDDKAVP